MEIIIDDDGIMHEVLTQKEIKKIKAEIKDIKDLYDLGKDDVSTKMFLEGVETVEKIIDKYKAESEG